MLETLTFSQCLNRMMQKYHLTIGDLTSIIGSRADLRHVLSDQSTVNKRKAIFDKLAMTKLFEEEDYKQLAHSLEISRLGIERFRFQQALESILTGESRQAEVQLLTDSGIPIAERLETLASCDKVEIICFNSCFSSLFAVFRKLFSNPSLDISMKHYVHADSSWNPAAEYVAIAMPLLFDARYTAYQPAVSRESRVPVLGGNSLFIRALQGDRIIEFSYIITGSTVAYELPNPSASRTFAFVNKLLSDIQPQPVPIKEESPYRLDFPSLCMTFLSHELNRATYFISHDLCFQQIPTAVAAAAFSDKGINSDEETKRILERTISIHEQRYQNQYKKRKPTYRIMTKKGCENFLATGMSADHFVGFRPFTPEERKVIFGSMIEAAKQNSFFVPLLLKDDAYQHRFNLCCYDKLAVSIDAKDTNYDIDNGYRSVFLAFPEFTKQYLSYYMDILVGERSHTRQESMQMLEEMYQHFLNEYQLSDL